MSEIVSIFKNTQTSKNNILHNIEAEQSVIGSLLINNKLYEKVSEILREYHFSHIAHQLIYEKISSLLEKNQTADPITLKLLLENDSSFEQLGGINYIIEICSNVISTVGIVDYAKIIHECFLRRELSYVGDDIISKSYNSDFETPTLTLIEDAEKKLFNLASDGDISKGFIHFNSAIKQAMQSAEKAFKREGSIVGVTTGLSDVDKYLGGLHPSDLIILAGRPSMGKTALATNIAFNAALANYKKNKEGAGVVFFSLEMSNEQLATRILSSQAGISSDKIRRGEIKNEDFPSLVKASRAIEDIKLFIDDTPALNINTLRNRARRLKRQFDIGMIVIDYLQLLESSSKSRSADNRANEISDISRGLKAIAKELNVPVIALSQLSRAVEQREDKRPQLSDLRESGSIEQDADVVMFVYREEYYESRKEPNISSDKHTEWQQKMAKIANQAELIIAKQRHGPIGTVKLFFNGKLTKFDNLAS